jgi:hypothetical protein
MLTSTSHRSEWLVICLNSHLAPLFFGPPESEASHERTFALTSNPWYESYFGKDYLDMGGDAFPPEVTNHA